jgi:ketosteroid isomerase-like protein
MNSDDLDLLRRGYEALARRDVEALLDCLHDDVELHTVSDGAFRGHAGVLAWVDTMDRAWKPWLAEVEGVEDLGSRGLVTAMLSGRSQVHGLETSQRFWIVWEVRDGKAFRGRHFADRRSAVEAATREGGAEVMPEAERAQRRG